MFGALIGTGWSLFQKTKWFREVGIETSAMKRLLVMECRKNLAILEPLRLADTSVQQDAKFIVHVAEKIQLEAMEILLASTDESRKSLNMLSGIPFEPLPCNGSESAEATELSTDPSVSVGARLLRLYVRMYAVKVFAGIQIGNPDSDIHGAATVHFRTRLRNIQRVLLAIEGRLSTELDV